MARSIEHRARFDASAAAVHAVLLDRDYLTARLRELGGKDAALLTHETEHDRARVVLRHGVPVEFLPSVLRRFTGDDLVLDRGERWRPRDGGGWEADLEVTVRGLPGSVTGTQELTDDGGGAQLLLTGTADVPFPMISGKLEGVVSEQIAELLGHESEFTRRWLAEHG